MPEATSPDRTASRWLMTLFRRRGLQAMLALALPLLGGALLVVQAFVLATILHRAIVEQAPLQSLLPQVGLLATLLLVRILIGTVAEIIAVAAGEAIKRGLRDTLFGAMLAKGPMWTRGQSSGALGTVVIEHVEAMDGFFVRYLPAMVQAAILPLAFAAIAIPFDWVVGLLFLVTAPLIPVFMALAGWGAEAATRAQATTLSRLSGRFADRLRGLLTLKLFGRDKAETEGIFEASEHLRGGTMRVMRIAFLSSAVLEFFAALGVAGVALYVGLTFLDLVNLRTTPLTLEAGLFCLLMAPEVYQPLRLLAAHYHDRAAAKAAAGEIAARLGELPVPAATETASSPIRSVAGSGAMALELRHLCVDTPTGRSVIEGADLSIGAGEHVAILGASGVGKSTLVEAIARLRPFEGEIVLDGTGLENWNETSLRSRTTVLGQRPHLFAGTIADNIRMGRSNACPTAIALAAERAQVMRFARELPDGLETKVGEDGIGLSGGEIHRVALARLYLRQPGLLLLDEPTAHLDAATESDVLDGLLEFARGRTLVVVTHSLAVAARMDRCLRIAGGRILPTPVPNRSLPHRQRGAA